MAIRETALRLDPLSRPAIYNYVSDLIGRNGLNQANRELEKIATIYPDLYTALRGDLMSVGGKWANQVLGDLDAMQIDPTGNDRIDLHREFALIGLERESLAMYETPFTEVLRILGKPGDAVTTAEADYAENPARSWRRRNLGMALAAAGDYDRARPILEEMWQPYGGQVVQFGVIDHIHVAALIAIRRHAGEEVGVGELLAAMRDNVRRLREAGITRADVFQSADFEEGLADYLAGEREKGLALIAKAAEDGYFILPKEAYLQTLYDDPGFAPILAGQEARQTSERNRFLAIVCNDNPYEEVWQPAEGTCARFAAEGGN